MHNKRTNNFKRLGNLKAYLKKYKKLSFFSIVYICVMCSLCTYDSF